MTGPEIPTGTKTPRARRRIQAESTGMRMLHLVLGGTAGSGGSASVRHYAELHAALTAAVSTNRRVVILGAHPGAGATTVAALVGTVLADRRRDPILLTELGTGSTQAGTRLEVGPGLTALQIASAPGRPQDAEAARAMVPRRRAGLWVLPSGVEPRVGAGPDVDPDQHREALNRIARYFTISIADAGPDLTRPVVRQTLEQAHAVCVVGRAAGRQAQSALDLADSLAGQLPSRPIVVLDNLGRTNLPRWVRARVDAPFERATSRPSVHLLGHDRHLAAGGAIGVGSLGARTVLNILEIGAAIVSSARESIWAAA